MNEEANVQTNEEAAEESIPSTLAEAADEAATSALAEAQEGEESQEAGKADEGAEQEPDTSNEDDEAPIEYEAFTVPEGFELSDETSEAIKELANEDRLTQEQAQRYANLAMAVAHEALAEEEAAYQEDIKAWRQEINREPNREENNKRALRALKKFLPEEQQKEVLNSFLGDLPLLRHLLVNVDKATSEGAIITGGKTEKKEVGLAEALWGDSMKKYEK